MTMRIKAFASAGLVVTFGLVLGESLRASPNVPTPETSFRLPGSAPPWVSRAQKLAPAADSRRVLITAYLSWRNPDELQQLLRDQNDPTSTHYGQFLTPQQFHEQFSPRDRDVTLVQSTLRGFGLNIEYTPASGLFVRASGTVAQIKEAFHVSQYLYAYQGRTLRAHAEEPLLPLALRGVVTYLGGLDDGRELMRPLHVSRTQPLLHPDTVSLPAAREQPQPPYGYDLVVFPCSNYWGDTRATLSGPTAFAYGDNLPWIPCGYTPQQVRQAYGINHTTRTGRGVRVAIADLYFSSTLVADVNRYSANHGLPQLTAENFHTLLAPNVNAVPAGDPCGSTGWLEEQSLDVTALHSVAPDADILFVGGTCDELDMVDQGVAIEPLYEVIDHRLADIVSDSWLYYGEADVPAGQMLSNNLEFLQAAIEGISIVNGSGDNGNLYLTATNTIASGNWPATSPLVTAVGGTSPLLVNASGEKEEYAWGTWYSYAFQSPLVSPSGSHVTVQGFPASLSFDGGSGGGPSLSQPEPFYQFGIVPESLATQTVNAAGSLVKLGSPKRVTPDISMFADPFVGFLYGETYLISVPPVDAGCIATSATTEYCEETIGGTSLATPLFAGVLALVNEARFAHHQWPVGFVNPALYQLAVGKQWFDDDPIIKVQVPSKPIGELVGFQGLSNVLGFAAIDSNLNSSGEVVENGDTTLIYRPGYDSATGLGAPNVPPLIRALSHEGW